MTNELLYTTGYKYRLEQDFFWLLPDSLTPEKPFEIDHISIFDFGVMQIKRGFAWDGATNAIDTKSVMRGALVHDALYKSIRCGFAAHLGESVEKVRAMADGVFREICLLDRMSKIRAAYMFDAIRIFGAKAAEPRKVFRLQF